MNIKIKPADRIFSQYIRLRDMECKRCHSQVRLNDKGLPTSHQASHYWSRGNWTTRFSPENVDTLCMACHRLWGGDYRREYEVFKRKQLGEKGYILLEVVAHTTGKKDWKAAKLVAQTLLDSVL